MTHLDEQYEIQLNDHFDRQLDKMIKLWEQEQAKKGIQLSNADRVGPEARHKLKGLIKFYAKKAHPFQSCVDDNRKRFGPKTEGVCAVLKDIIRGTTKWRGHNNPRDHGAPGAVGLSEDMLMDEQTYDLISKLGELDLWELYGLAQLEDDGQPYVSLQEAHPIEKLDLANTPYLSKGDAAPVANPTYPNNFPTNPALPDQSGLNPADHEYLDSLLGHHHAKIAKAVAYTKNKDAHPIVAEMAANSMSESGHAIGQVNRMKKTGKRY